MKKLLLMLPLLVAIVAMTGCKKSSTNDPASKTEELKEDDAYYSSFKIAGYGLFGEPTMISGTATQFKISETESVDAQLGYMEWIGWDGGLSFNEGTNKFVGKGFMIEGSVPVYVVTSDNYKGQFITPTTKCWKVESTKTPTEGVMNPGTIDAATYGDWINYLWFDETQAIDTAKLFSKTNGTLISMSDINNKVEEWQYLLYRGFINKMVINFDNADNIISWGADINLSNVTSTERCFGFHYDINNGDTTITKPYNYRSVNVKFHEDVLNAEETQKAPARNADNFISVDRLRKPYTLKK